MSSYKSYRNPELAAMQDRVSNGGVGILAHKEFADHHSEKILTREEYVAIFADVPEKTKRRKAR